MNKYLFPAIAILFSSFGAQAQKLKVVVNYVVADTGPANNNISYKPGKLLTWSDFKANPIATSDAAAITSAGFGIKLAFTRRGNNAQLYVSVSCTFSKKDSWVKKNNKTAYILNHEQKHFDIAYIHTVMFIQKLKNGDYTVANYAAVIEKIYNETAREMSKMQNEYDSETRHSTIMEKQADWNRIITKQLALAIPGN